MSCSVIFGPGANQCPFYFFLSDAWYQCICKFAAPIGTDQCSITVICWQIRICKYLLNPENWNFFASGNQLRPVFASSLWEFTIAKMAYQKMHHLIVSTIAWSGMMHALDSSSTSLDNQLFSHSIQPDMKLSTVSSCFKYILQSGLNVCSLSHWLVLQS